MSARSLSLSLSLSVPCWPCRTELCRDVSCRVVDVDLQERPYVAAFVAHLRPNLPLAGCLADDGNLLRDSGGREPPLPPRACTDSAALQCPCRTRRTTLSPTSIRQPPPSRTSSRQRAMQSAPDNGPGSVSCALRMSAVLQYHACMFERLNACVRECRRAATLTMVP